MSVTKPATVKDVFHLPDTRSRSRKKNAVEATIAIDIIQKETPTGSLTLKLPFIVNTLLNLVFFFSTNPAQN